jgi:hypothetical protein
MSSCRSQDVEKSTNSYLGIPSFGTQEYNPGTLDCILYTDSVIMLEKSFELNTEITTEDELVDEGSECDAGP